MRKLNSADTRAVTRAIGGPECGDPFATLECDDILNPDPDIKARFAGLHAAAAFGAGALGRGVDPVVAKVGALVDAEAITAQSDVFSINCALMNNDPAIVL